MTFRTEGWIQYLCQLDGLIRIVTYYANNGTTRWAVEGIKGLMSEEDFKLLAAKDLVEVRRSESLRDVVFHHS